MSSDYHVLCLSHDPAFEMGHWHSSRDGRGAALAAASNPGEYQETAHHVGCDLVVGRYSYPLVEVGCPPTTKMSPDHRVYHPHDAEWTGTTWLRLLWHANRSTDPGLLAAADAALGCWSPERLHRLRYALRVVADPSNVESAS